MNCVAFDLDGVLVDSRSAYLTAFCEAVHALGFACERPDVEKLLGRPVVEVVSALLPSDAEKVVRARSLVNKTVLAEGVLETITVSDEAQPCLEGLSSAPDVSVYLVTNSGSEFTDKVLRHFGLRDYFMGVLTADDSPSKEERLLRLRESDTDSARFFYVGDLPYDVAISRKTGFTSVAVYNRMSWVYPDREKILGARPDYLIASLLELPPILGIREIRQLSI